MAAELFRHPLVVVIWDDAHARNQAVEYAEAEVVQQHKPERCKIVGLLVHEDEKGVSIYNEDTGPDSVRGLSFIPKAMIVDILRFGYLKKPRPKRAVPSTVGPTS